MSKTAHSWFANKEFRYPALTVIIMTFLFQYFGNFIVGDSYNIYTVYLPDYGIPLTTLATGFSIGGVIGIAGSFFVGLLMGKYGPRKVCSIGIAIIGLTTLLLALFINPVMYLIAMIVTRSISQCFVFGLATFTSNWFIQYRGRVLGINTMGGPLATATALSGLTFITAQMGFKTAFSLVGVLVIVLAILTAILCRDKPEDLGLQPDGIVRSEEEIQRLRALSESSAGSWTPKKIFTNKQSILVIVGCTIMNFVMGCTMMYFVVRMLSEGVTIQQAIAAMSIGGLCAIPMSYFYGWLDDKVNTPTAMILLVCIQIITLLDLIFTKGGIFSVILGGFGVANLTGALPNLHPSINAHVYGRDHFMYCHKYSATVTAIAGAFTASFVVLFVNASVAAGGTERAGYIHAYIVMIVLAVAAIVCFALLNKKSYDERLKEESDAMVNAPESGTV